LFSSFGFVSMDHGFAQGDHRLLELPPTALPEDSGLVRRKRMAGLLPDILRLFKSILQCVHIAEMAQQKTRCIPVLCVENASGTPYAFPLIQQERRAAINNKISREGGER
jgi:hypothetical protein